MKGQSIIIGLVLAMLLALGAFAMYSAWHWGFYDRVANYRGVVSSYQVHTDVFGFQQYKLEFYGGGNVVWAQNKNQSYIANWLGGDINATEGQDCRLGFKGHLMMNWSCVNATKTK